MNSPEVYFHDNHDLISNICHNTQEIFKIKDVDQPSPICLPVHRVLYHDVLLPKGASLEFQKYQFLWEAVLNFKDKEDPPYKALHLIIPLSREAPLIGNVAFCKRIADIHYISQGVAVQVDLHREDECDRCLHAHFLVSPYTFSGNGSRLEKWIDVSQDMEEESFHFYSSNPVQKTERDVRYGGVKMIE